MSITYGIDSLPAHSPLIENAAATLAAVVFAATPGSFLVDFLPILKYVPAWFPGRLHDHGTVDVHSCC
jgi:hypothetical protein